jgi:hypothetical protein
MTWKFGVATDIGGRSEQQDRLAVLHSPDDRRHLVVVADGMGGLQNGAKAAQILIDVASDRFMRHKQGDSYGFLNDICQTAHRPSTICTTTADRRPVRPLCCYISIATRRSGLMSAIRVFTISAKGIFWDIPMTIPCCN